MAFLVSTRNIRLFIILTILAISLYVYFTDTPAAPEPVHSLPVHPEQPVVHDILGMEESCVQCHGSMEGFSDFHKPEAIGCAPCHGGNPREEGKKKAHEGMWTVPGNLDDVFYTCGSANCHQSIAERVEKSLMATMAGVVSVDRFVFGESSKLSDSVHIQEIGFSPADLHLRHLCASCHLGNKKTKPAPVRELSRGGGCNACHLNYSEEARKDLFRYEQVGIPPKAHPALTLEVKNDHCFGCHSRSGRISTNYEGWHETKLRPMDVRHQEGFRQLEDGRILRRMPADVHHEAGLSCIDCHNSQELMGDGNIYLHEEEAVKTTCEDCHFSGSPKTIAYAAMDEESQKLISLRKWYYEGLETLSGLESGYPMINTRVDEAGRPYLIGKNSGKRHPLKPPADICTKGKAHDALTCAACHTGWAPQCVGCHNTFDDEQQAFDLLDKKVTDGKWEEHLGVFFAELPTLGVVEGKTLDKDEIRKIKAFIPGMIMTIDPKEAEGEAEKPEIFHRLFAPTASHTIQLQGRSCRSCHSSPLALGYGRGSLDYIIEGKEGNWQFESEYAYSPQDGLPQDSWIGFLEEGNHPYATRSNARPFNSQEQKRILLVGACLECHQDNSKVMLDALESFDRSLKKRSPKCILPFQTE
jgi:hypothetical protein